MVSVHHRMLGLLELRRREPARRSASGSWLVWGRRYDSGGAPPTRQAACPRLRTQLIIEDSCEVHGCQMMGAAGDKDPSDL